MQNTILGQHRAIWQEAPAWIFGSIRSLENEGILYVFLVFQTEEVGQKGGCGSQTQLRGVALEVPRRIRTSSSLPPLGVVLRAANQDINDCRWQSCLCSVPQRGKGGVVGIFLAVTIQRTAPPLRLAKSRLTAVARLHGACASLSQPLRAASSPIGEPRRRYEFARGFIKPQVPAATPQPLRRQLSFA